MKKIICDRCGKEIENVKILGNAQNYCASKSFKASKAFKALNGIHYELTSRDCCAFITQTYDLCDDCQRDLYDWLNNGREEE